jgi:hypothetical protein
MRLVAFSTSRHNGGVAAKRRYGSSTITRWIVRRKEDTAGPWVEVETGGRTPGDRKTAALVEGEKLLRAKGLSGGSGSFGRARRHMRQLGVTLPPRGSRRRKLLVLSAGLASFALVAALLIKSPGGIGRKLPVIPGLNPLYVQLAAKWAAHYGLPLQWIVATMLAESGGNPNSVGDYHVLPEGASVGLMQVNVRAHGPDMTAQGITRAMMFNPDINIQWGTKILAKCVQRVRTALAGRSGDVGALARLCYTGVNTPGAITAGRDPYDCPSCANNNKNWNARLAQTSAAA